MKATIKKKTPKATPSQPENGSPELVKLGRKLRHIGSIFSALDQIRNSDEWDEYTEQDTEFHDAVNTINDVLIRVSNEYAAKGGFGRVPE